MNNLKNRHAQFVDLFSSVLEFSDDGFFLYSLIDFAFLSTEVLDFLNFFLAYNTKCLFGFFRKLVFNFALLDDNLGVHVSSMLFSSILSVSLSNVWRVEGIFSYKYFVQGMLFASSFDFFKWKYSSVWVLVIDVFSFGLPSSHTRDHIGKNCKCFLK